MKQCAEKLTPVQSIIFRDIFGKDAVLEFSGEHQSNDAGLVLLGGFDRSIRLSETIANAILDARDPAKTKHSIQELIQQRLYGIVCGYPNCNSAKELQNDPAFRLLLSKALAGDEGIDQASQQIVADAPVFSITICCFQVGIDLFAVGINDPAIAR